MLHHFAHVLGIFASGDQQSVCGLDYDRVVDANYGYELPRRMDVISARVQREDALRRNQVAVRGRVFRDLVFVQRRP